MFVYPGGDRHAAAGGVHEVLRPCRPTRSRSRRPQIGASAGDVDRPVDRARAAVTAPTGTAVGTRVGRALLALVPLVFLAVFFVWPVGAILARGLWHDGSLDLAAFADTLREPGLAPRASGSPSGRRRCRRVLTLAVGLPLTAVLSRVQFRGRALVHALVIVPFVLPTIVVATAFRSLGVERSLGAILLAHCFFNLAVVVRVVGASWETLDRRTDDAARDARRGPVRTFWSVTLPALRPALVAAASIVFLFCFTSFGVILVLGGPTFATLETEIYRQTAELLDLRTAAVLSILQLLAVVVALVVAGVMAGRRRSAGASAARDRVRLRTTARSPRSPRSRSLPGLVLVVVPVVELVRRSLADGALGWSRLDRRHAPGSARRRSTRSRRRCRSPSPRR